MNRTHVHPFSVAPRLSLILALLTSPLISLEPTAQWGSPPAAFGEEEVVRVHTGASLRISATSVAGDGLGRGVVGGADFDGDGRLDYAALTLIDVFNGGSKKAVRIYSGANGQEIERIVGTEALELYIEELAALDIDNDGRAELAVGVRNIADRTLNRIEVYSFQPLRLRYSIARPPGEPFSSFPSSLAVVADYDFDSVGEIAVGDTYRSEVVLFSGRDGAALRSVTAPTPDLIAFGATVADLGDVTADGISDMAIGVLDNTLHLFDGARIATPTENPFLLTVTLGERGDREFGRAVLPLGDMNGDGRADFGVSAPAYLSSAPGSFRVVTLDEFGDLVTLRLFSDAGEPSFGTAAAKVRDVTGDGVPEIAIGVPRPSSLRLPYVILYSGSTGEVLRVFTGQGSTLTHFGWRVDTVGDINNDGIDEIIVADPRSTLGNQPSDFASSLTTDPWAPWSGAVFIYSAAPESRFVVPTPTPIPPPPTPTPPAPPTPRSDVPGGSLPPSNPRIQRTASLANAIANAESVARGARSLRTLRRYVERELTGARAQRPGEALLRKVLKMLNRARATRWTVARYRQLGGRIVVALGLPAR